MGLGAEGFSSLAILEARDQASAIYDKVQAKIGQFSETMKAAADSADVSGAKIDESFLKTASGADALTVATAKAEAAQAKLDASTKAQADAEKALLDAQTQAKAAADGDTAAMGRQVAAADKLAAAQKETAKQTKALRDAQADQEAIAKAQSGANDDSVKKTSSLGSKLGGVAATMGKVGLGVVVAGGLLAKGAADFESSTTVLQTSGGEVESQMGQVRAGILSLSAGTGTAIDPLVKGMYMIGSASYTGSAGLKVLQAAAQGAKAEGADLGTVSNALTTAMKDYGVSAKDAGANQKISNAYMDQMIAIVQNGKTTTEDLAASLSNVLPIASAVGLSFAQVGGAMATMTGAGESAQQSSQNLANTIRSLESPNAVAVKEMQQMGLNSTQLAKNLGKTGLAGTIKEMTDAIQQHMGPAGTVAVNAFQNSAAAAQNVQQIMSKLPASVQDLAKSYMAGSVSSKDWKKDLQALDPITAHLMQQFGQAADQTHQFNSMLTSGTPAQQTAAQALQKMMGGATGLNVALMLSANNYKTVTDKTKAVADAAKGAGSSVDGWKEIQGNFNQKLLEAKQSVEATSISIGTALLPTVTSLLQHIMAIIAPIASWVQGHQKLTVIILGAAAGLGLLVGAINLAVKAYKGIKSAIDAVSTAVSKIVGLFGGAADAQDAAAASADGAAASADGLAASEDGAATSTEAATVASDENSASWLRTGLTAAGTAIKFLALKAVQVAGTIATWASVAATWALNAALAVLTSPITLIVVGIAALAAGVIYAYTHFKVFRDIVQDVWNWLKTAVVDVIDFVKDHWQMIVQIVTGPIGIIAVQVYQHWSTIKRYFTDAVHDIISFLTFWFVGLPVKFAGWLAAGAAAVGRGVGDIVGFFLGMPGRVTGAIFGFFEDLMSTKFGQWIEGIATTVGNKGLDILKWFIALPSKIISALGDLSSTLVNAGVSLIKGFVNGIDSMFGDVEHELGSLTSKLTSWKGPPSTDKILLSDNGKLIIQGLIAGFDQEIPAVQAKLHGLTANIQQAVTPTLPALPASGSGATGGGTVVNINMAGAFNGAHIMGDHDMDMFAQKISSAVAQHLPAGGLRVAM